MTIRFQGCFRRIRKILTRCVHYCRAREWFFCCIMMLALLIPSYKADAAELRVAVAANFLSTLKQLTAEYHKLQDDRIRITTGSTGGLYAQIRHGAPFDLFLSADSRRPELLEKEGLTLIASRFTYAKGILVLWSKQADLVDNRGAVLDQTAGYLSLPNPVNAPYGEAARQLLTQRNLWQKLDQSQQIIRSGNVRQTLFQVISGAAPMGFIALSQARHPEIAGKGSLWIPDPSLYDPIIQQGVVLASTKEPEAALRFQRWLQSDQARSLIVASGYQSGSQTMLVAQVFANSGTEKSGRD